MEDSGQIPTPSQMLQQGDIQLPEETEEARLVSQLSRAVTTASMRKKLHVHAHADAHTRTHTHTLINMHALPLFFVPETCLTNLIG